MSVVATACTSLCECCLLPWCDCTCGPRSSRQHSRFACHHYRERWATKIVAARRVRRPGLTREQRALAERYHAMHQRLAAHLYAMLLARFRAIASMAMLAYQVEKTHLIYDRGPFAWGPPERKVRWRSLFGVDAARMLIDVLRAGITAIVTETLDLVAQMVGTEALPLESPAIRPIIDGFESDANRAIDTTATRVGVAMDKVPETVTDAQYRDALRQSIISAGEGQAATLARTTIALAGQQAAHAQFRDAGIEYVLISDGPNCGWTDHDDPDLADGSLRSIDDADDYPIAHPNCVRFSMPAPGVTDEGESLDGEEEE